MSDNTKLFGKCQSIEHKGQTYRPEPLTLEQLAEFEVWIEGQLWKAHRRSQRHLDPEEYKANSVALTARIGAGEWAYPQPAFFQVMFTLAGCQHAMLLALRKNHPEVDEELADEITNSHFETILSELMQQEADQANPSTGGTVPLTPDGSNNPRQSSTSSESLPTTPSTSP